MQEHWLMELYTGDPNVYITLLFMFYFYGIEGMNQDLLCWENII